MACSSYSEAAAFVMYVYMPKLQYDICMYDCTYVSPGVYIPQAHYNLGSAR